MTTLGSERVKMLGVCTFELGSERVNPRSSRDYVRLILQSVCIAILNERLSCFPGQNTMRIARSEIGKKNFALNIKMLAFWWRIPSMLRNKLTVKSGGIKLIELPSNNRAIALLLCQSLFPTQ